MIMSKMAITPKGLRLILAGVITMIAGYILMMGPAPVRETFNYAMFDWQRIVAAPVVILCGVVVIIIGIMGRRDRKEDR